MSNNVLHLSFLKIMGISILSKTSLADIFDWKDNVTSIAILNLLSLFWKIKVPYYWSGMIQPLTEMSTILLRGGGGLERSLRIRLTILLPSVSRFWILDISEPYGSPRPFILLYFNLICFTLLHVYHGTSAHHKGVLHKSLSWSMCLCMYSLQIKCD
jgi:hypothetical protein